MHVLAFYNVKGGVGKTTSCVNVAFLAAQEGGRTLLWDLDPQGAATFYLGETAAHVKNLKKIIKDRKHFAAQIRPTKYDNLSIVPADFNLRYLDILLEGDKKSDQRLAKLTKHLHDRFDYLILDSPPSISTLSDSLFRAVDYLLMPIIPTTLSMQSFEQVCGYLAEEKGNLASVVPFFSMVDRRKKMHKDYVAARENAGLFLKTHIPYRSAIEQMGVHQAPLPHFAPQSKEAQIYGRLWREIRARIRATAALKPAGK